MQDPFSDESVVLLDPTMVNVGLLQLGARVTLTWKTIDTGEKRVYVAKSVNKKPGKRRMLPKRQHILKGGRFQLGQKSGKLPQVCLRGYGVPFHL